MLLATPAYADPPRYTRKPKLAIDVTFSDRVKPIQPTTTQGRAVTADEVMAIETQTEPLRREQEVILRQLANKTPDDDPDKPDLLFRLAEHYAKQQRFWRLKSLEPAVPAKPRR
ncbi:MAG: Tetratricopeptide repeat protein [Myxococcales bacterium]|nr:Tetratricopeptide repeat protein [Myxococcales bacterium]